MAVCQPYWFQTPEVLRKRLRYLEAVSGRKTKMVHSVNGGEYTAASLREYFENRGIIHQFSAPYTPEQNGKAERLNRTLAETTRAMMFSSKASDDLWDEAMVTASYLRNRRPAKGVLRTPYEAFTGVKPDISHLRTFGARTYVMRHVHNKLEACCCPGFLLGYAATSKAYRALLDDRRIVIRPTWWCTKVRSGLMTQPMRRTPEVGTPTVFRRMLLAKATRTQAKTSMPHWQRPDEVGATAGRQASGGHQPPMLLQRRQSRPLLKKQ
jgi:hypothetical protein